MNTLDIVIPVYNESSCIEETVRRLDSVQLNLSADYMTTITFVDDGSSDDTYRKLKTLAETRPHYRLIKLSRNFGHQIALTAGLDHSSADYVAIIDGDLQDPPELIPEMLKKMSEGHDVVYGKRISREGEGFFKIFTARLFYRTLSALCDIKIPENTGDFRVINAKVLKAIQSMHERHRFIRGLVPFSGYRAFAFEYERKKRFAGETKYPVRKMIKFALDAIFSFSTRPLKLMMLFGLFSLLLSLGFMAHILYLRIFVGGIVPGFTVTILVSTFFGGIQILSVSLLGEYVGRIFEEVKRRPLYFIDEKVN